MLQRPRPEAPTSSSAADSINSYDEVPYESHPYPQTHPSRLATIATLFGLKPPPVDRCRALELGCAGGGNLIPLAETLPESWFVGIDLSGRQIEEGERVVRALGLRNISLRLASILDVDETYGSFDYIICHGVFSWVSDAVQHKILEICDQRLSPSGIAYISYNTFPGWHMRGMIRDMMRYHALRFETPELRVRQARALLDFLAQSVRQDGSSYSTLLRSELESLRQQPDHYLYHEHLEEYNSPLYFHQFMDLADKHGLRYLGETQLTTMFTGNFSHEVQRALESVANDQVQGEQYLDFLRNRTFRATLLVHEDQIPNWNITPAALHNLHLSTSAKINLPAGDALSNSIMNYQTSSGITLSVSSPPVKVAMQIFAEHWPSTISFAELNRLVNERLERADDDSESLAIALLKAYISSDFLELRTHPITAARAGDKPMALPSVRVRLSLGQSTAATFRHELFRPSDTMRKILPLLDGTRDRAAILDQLTEMALAGEITVQSGGHDLTDRLKIREALTPVLEKALSAFGDAGVLVG